MKKIAILGSTGSIGKSTLEVVENLKGYAIIALSANNNYKLLSEQIKKFKPNFVSIGNIEGYNYLKELFPQLEIYLGEEGLKKIGSLDESDILISAVSGSIGIEATLNAIKKEKRIGLANKETMVAAGDLINHLLKEYKAEIIPIDSEHSAIFQALEGNNIKEVNRLIITASGGPFRGKSIEFLKNVNSEDALKHPNWSMGSKISIDSSTLVNKGLEVIEAHQLFGIAYDNIEVLIHPQSIIHSMVEYCDGSVIAQLGCPDMKTPIQYALTYPKRLNNYSINFLNFLKDAKELNFEEPNMDVFKGLSLAFKAGKIGGTMPAVYNASNEVAVSLFLDGKITFLDIYTAIEEAMAKHKVLSALSLDNILKADKATRVFVKNFFGF